MSLFWWTKLRGYFLCLRFTVLLLMVFVGCLFAPSSAYAIDPPSTPVLDPSTDSGISNSDRITFNTALILNFTCEPLAEVHVSDGLAPLGSDTCSLGGTLSFLTNDLAEGLHTFSATQTDLGGNTSEPSGTLNVTIDITAPITPSIPDLKSSSDSGTSNSDDITNATSPIFTVNCSFDGHIVYILDNSSAVASGVCSSGTADISVNGLLEGFHYISSQESDIAGNSSDQSSPLLIALDYSVLAPGTPDLDPGSDSGDSDTDNYTNFSNLRLILSCDEFDTGSIYVYDDQTLLGTTPCPSNGSAEFFTGPLTSGTHLFSATQTDTAGNTSVHSSSLSVTVDTQSPPQSGRPDLSSSDDSGTSATDNVTRITSPHFDIECTEDGNLIELLLVGVNTVLGSGICSQGTAHVSTSSLEDGTFILASHEIDLAGNTGPASLSLSITIDTEEGEPEIPDLVSTSDSGQSNSDNLTNDSTPTFVIVCTSGNLVSLSDGITIIGSALCISGTATIESSMLSDNDYEISASQTDLAGNISAQSEPLYVTIDTTAPDAPFMPDLQAESDSGNSNSDDLTNVLGGVYDVICAENGNTVELLENSTLLGSDFCIDGVASISSSTLSSGVHLLSARERDLAGNTSLIGPDLSVTFDREVNAPSIPDLTALTDTGLYDNDNLTNISTPDFVVACEDDGLVELMEGAVVRGSEVCIAGTAVITSDLLSSGVHLISARQTDATGNLSQQSGTLSITIDTTPSSPSGIPNLIATDDSGTSNTDNLTKVKNPSFDISCQTNLNTIRLMSGEDELGSGSCQSGTVRITSIELDDGEYYLTSNQEDLAGNISADSGILFVEIDTTPPAPPEAPDLDAASDTGFSNTDNITTDTTGKFLISCETLGGLVQLREGTTVLGSATCTTGTVAITSSILAQGTHFLTARETDKAGNISLDSDVLTVIIDTSIPPTPGVPDLVEASDTGSSSTDNNTKDNTPTVSIICDGNSTVRLFLGTTLLGSAPCVNGIATITSSTLSDGSRSVRAVQVNAAGTSSAASAVLTIVIDTTPPAAPVIRSPVNESVVEVSQPTISGTGFANGVLFLYDGGNLIGSISINSTGQWSLVPANPLDEGSHTLTATQNDIAGNTSPVSSSVIITIETTVFVTSPAVIKWNTFLKQWNFLELVANGAAGFVVRAQIFNTASVEITEDSIALAGNAEFDYDVNNAIRVECSKPNPSPGCIGLVDLDNDGLIDSYGTVLLTFEAPSGSRLVGRMTNYRPSIGLNAFDFAFPRELRPTLKGTTYAAANTYDPQNLGFGVPNFGELVHLGNLQTLAQGGSVAPGRYTVNIYDPDGVLTLSFRVPSDNEPGLKALGEIDFAAGHQILDSSNAPIQSVYLVEIIPDDPTAEYLFSVARYSSNSPLTQVPSTYNYALAVPGRAGARDSVFAGITNETFSCGQAVNWVEVANVSSRPQAAVLTFRNSAGSVTGVFGPPGNIFPPKGQKHFYGSGMLTLGDIGSVRVDSAPGTFIVQSMVYIHSCNENLVDSAYVSLARPAGRRVQIGTVNTFLGMHDYIRSWSAVNSALSLSMRFKPYVGSAITATRTLPPYGSDSVLIDSPQGLNFPANQYGSARVDAGVASAFVSEVIRSRTQSRNGREHVDFVIPSELR